MKPVLKILIADDHPFTTSGIAQYLSSNFSASVTVAYNGKQAYQLIMDSPPDILIADIQMPEMDGIELVTKVKRFFEQVKIIILTYQAELQTIKSLCPLVDAFLFKDSNTAILGLAIDALQNNKKFYSPEIAEMLLNSSFSSANTIKLSQREREILPLIAQQMTSEEIAGQLCISKYTVETHRKNLLEKFEVKKSIGLIKKAQELGFL